MSTGDTEETYFPRGGDLGRGKKAFKSKGTFIFDTHKNKTKPKKNLGRREREKIKRHNPKDDESFVQFKRAEYLKYPIPEGTLMMCCVTEIHPKSLSVKLSNRISAKILPENISKTLSKISNDNKHLNLNDIFKIGDLFPCKRISSDLNTVCVSTDPAEVNSDIIYTQVYKGILIIGAIESVTDHGYAVTTGIPNVTAFLPNGNALDFIESKNDGKPLVPGQLVWCRVKKFDINDGKNIIEVSIKPQETSKEISSGRIMSEMLIPGATLKSTITEVRHNALFIQIDGTDFEGFILDDYLKPNTKLDDYSPGDEISATLLYKYPHSELAGYSLWLKPNMRINKEIENGTLFKRAKIIELNPRGVILELKHDDKIFKGMISRRRIGDFKGQGAAADFPVGTHITVKVIGFDYMEPIYSCSNEDQIIHQNVVSSQDIHPGVDVTIKIEGKKHNGYVGKVGMLRALLPFEHVSDDPAVKKIINIGSNQDGRVLKVDKNTSTAIVTLKEILLTNKPLLDLTKVSKGESYPGTVVSVGENGIRVSFFNGISAHINSDDLIEDVKRYKFGQTVTCYVSSVYEQRVKFTLLKSVDQSTLFIGKKYSLIITGIDDNTGITCIGEERGEKFKADIPIHHMSDHPELWHYILKKFKIGDILQKAFLFNYYNGKPIFTMRESVIKFFKDNKEKLEEHKWLIEQDTVIPGHLKIDNSISTVSLPIPNFNREINVKLQNPKVGLNNPYKNITYYNNQPISLQLMTYTSDDIKLYRNKEIYTDEKWAVDNLSSFISRIEPFQTFKIGDQLKNLKKVKKSKKSGTFFKTNSHKSEKLIQVHGNDSNPISAITLYDDLLNNVVHSVSSSAIDKHKSESSIRGSEKANILYANLTMMVGWISRIQKFVYIPCKGLLNGIKANLYAQGIQNVKIIKSNDQVCFGYPSNVMDFLNEIPEDINSDIEKYFPLGNCESIEVVKSKNNEIKKNKKKIDEVEVPSKKIKLSPVKEEIKEEKILKRKKIESDLAKEMKIKKAKVLDDLSLENVGGFDFDATPSDLIKAISGETEEISDSDEEETIKKRLTPAERKAAAIEAEKRLRQREEELLSADINPKSADHFDRILIGEPNNSKRWIQYMAFHLQTADFDKARSVAQRALKTINVRETQERLNVWIALLNLDHTYSTPDVFQETLKEALKYNDDYAINIRVLDIYAESQKTVEVEQLTSHLVRKYRTKMECWLHCQEALMAVGLAEKARSFLQRSLTSLQKKDHVNLLSRFALLENKHNFVEQSRTLFENLLASYPQRVDIWNVYVDMLIKSNKIDLARNVLQRIKSHKLPVRKMKSLYNKWVSFEETYGTPKSVLDVKASAQQYIENITTTVVKEEVVKEEVDDDFIDDADSDENDDDESDEE